MRTLLSLRRVVSLRVAGTLCLVACVMFMTVGFTSMTVGIPGFPETYHTLTGTPFAGCSKPKPGETAEEAAARQKAEFLSYAREVRSALSDLQPLVSSIKPAAGEIVAKALPVADQVIAAIESGNVTTATELLRTLLPLVNSVTAMFTNDTNILAIAAIANIGLHFLINHLPLPPASTKMARRVSDPLVQFKDEPVWGCDFHPDRCKKAGLKN